MVDGRRPGERAGLNRERVLDVALDLVDHSGTGALTMRRLGAELGVEAMTLYHHVPGKQALLDGLVERVLTQALPLDTTEEDWRPLLRAYAHGLRSALLRHPGVLPLVAARPAVTPAALDTVERCLRVLTGAGIELGRALHTVNSLALLAISHATAEAAGLGEEGPGSAEWLAGADPGRYPLLTEAARTGAGVDDAERFELAVEALLAGVSRPAAPRR
ncbi:TetR/AcrR family transcriptional regulator C-terminal domain-containing protein [Streptomyces orinoci]|uniref:TetR/AcrR family transcriptional regulator C-terminal domain-containing protein n=1 Tax=Streptomyces orinoci TaxID=67339 RepID=A0ABV3JR59_STRON|nr:TetR/AcrR family transcriptional regulator C-terminal domain-containing protein [Streptomyces orinoci]